MDSVTSIGNLYRHVSNFGEPCRTPSTAAPPNAIPAWTVGSACATARELQLRRSYRRAPISLGGFVSDRVEIPPLAIRLYLDRALSGGRSGHYVPMTKERRACADIGIDPSSPHGAGQVYVVGVDVDRGGLASLDVLELDLPRQARRLRENKTFNTDPATHGRR